MRSAIGPDLASDAGPTCAVGYCTSIGDIHRALPTSLRAYEPKDHDPRDRLADGKPRFAPFRESRLSAMGSIGAMLAHEISQPLAAILNYVDTARDQLARLSVTQSELAATINALEHAAREAMRASEIVGGIRAFIAGDDRVRLVEDLVTIVAEAVALTLVSTSDHAIRVSLDYADQKPCRVMVDRVQVQQVLSNLVRNAVNAMGGSGDLCVSIRCTDTSAIVRVADSGLGVGAPDEQMAAAAFDGTRMPGNGLGLGLSICRTIVEAHGGRIWARACPDSGAEFLFTLRLALSDPGDAR